MHQLNPQLNREKWDIEESKKLFELHQQYKNKWKFIAEWFPGRTDNSIKNQFFSIVRKALRKACKVLGNISNTSVINKIRPKVLSNYLAIDFEISKSGVLDQTETISMNDFVQKFAFNKYNDLAKGISDGELVIIDKCIELLNKLNNGYLKKKAAKIQSKQNYTETDSLSKTKKTKANNPDEGSVSNVVIPEDSKNCIGLIVDDEKTFINVKINYADFKSKFETFLNDIKSIKPLENNADDKLITFFKELGSLSYNIVNVLKNNDKNYIDNSTMGDIVNIAQSTQNIISDIAGASYKTRRKLPLSAPLTEKITLKVSESLNYNAEPLDFNNVSSKLNQYRRYQFNSACLPIQRPNKPTQLPQPINDRFSINKTISQSNSLGNRCSQQNNEICNYSSKLSKPNPVSYEPRLEKRSVNICMPMDDIKGYKKYVSISNYSLNDFKCPFAYMQDKSFGQVPGFM